MRPILLCFLICSSGISNCLNAQNDSAINYLEKNSLYQQNFDGLPNSGSFVLVGKGPHWIASSPILGNNLTGWQFTQNAGSGSNSIFLVGTGSGAGQGTFSVGSTNSADRALGTLASSAGISSIGIVLMNATGSVLNNITVSFTAEQWRKGGSGNKNTWLCKYKTGHANKLSTTAFNLLPLLNFSSLQTSSGSATLNGNLAVNQSVISQTLTINDWNPGEQLILKWEDSDEVGSDDLMAIDQFNFSANYKEPDPIEVEAIYSLSENPTNADTIQYGIRFSGNLSNLSNRNLAIKTTGLTNVKIVDVEGNGSAYTAKVYTGEGEGVIQIGISNDTALFPNILNLPFFSIDSQIIDKVGPEMVDVKILNQTMKIGDTVEVSVQIKKEIDTCKLIHGFIHQIPLYNFSKTNDSSYSCYFVIPANGTDVSAAEDISVSIILSDAINNKSIEYAHPIIQSNDRIDVNKPLQSGFYHSGDTLLKAGDSLKLVLRFNEPVLIQTSSPTNYIPVTIGSKVRNATCITLNPSDSLVFMYIIQPNELDKDGIKISSAFSTKNLLIQDVAGNSATISVKSTNIQHIKIDAVTPEFINPKDTTLIFCESIMNILLDTILKVNNKERNELLTWSLISAPTKINITQTTNNQKSTSNNIFPENFYVQNLFKYHGIDSCIFTVSDGINTFAKKILFSITPEISENKIENIDAPICKSSTPPLIIGSEKNKIDSTAVYVWEMSTLSDSTGFAAASGTIQSKDYQPPSLIKNTWFRRKILNGGCTKISNSVFIKVWSNNLWTGKTNNNWNVRENWCGNVIPSDTSDVYIPVTYTNAPLINEHSTVRNLEIEKNAALTITGSLEILDRIYADTAAIQAEIGTIDFSGKSKQVIEAYMFKEHTIGNVFINNVEGVTLSYSTSISNSLVLSKGSLQTNHLLTLKHKAIVGASANGTQIIGSVKAEYQFGDPIKRAILFGHPFMDAIPMNRLTISPYASYSNPKTNTDSFSLSNNWKKFNPNPESGNNAWLPFQGIRIENKGFTDSSLFVLEGKLNTGLQEIALQKSDQAGFNVISNPFLSPVNVASFTNGGMVGKYYWIWNPKQGLNGGFSAIPANQSYILNPFNAFVAEAKGYHNNAIFIPEESKTNLWNEHPDSINLFEGNNGFNIELGLYSENIFWDRLVLLEDAGVRNSKDSLDGLKLFNPDLNLYTLSSDNQKLSVDARKLDNSAVIPIRIETNQYRNYYFKVNQAFLPKDNLLVLHDRYTNRFLPLQKDSIYHFSTDSISTAKTFLTGRFDISKSYPRENFNDIINQLTIKIYPNPVANELMIGIKSGKKESTQFKIYSVSGALLKSINIGEIQFGTVKINVSDLNNGNYILQVNSGNHQQSLRFIKL